MADLVDSGSVEFRLAVSGELLSRLSVDFPAELSYDIMRSSMQIPHAFVATIDGDGVGNPTSENLVVGGHLAHCNASRAHLTLAATSAWQSGAVDW